MNCPKFNENSSTALLSNSAYRKIEAKTLTSLMEEVIIARLESVAFICMH